jgi:hypothetical protein
MKLIIKQIYRSIQLGAGGMAIALLLVTSSCATQTSTLGQTVLPHHVLQLTSNGTDEKVWQTKDVEVTYKTIKTGNTYTIEGSMSVNDSVTRTFPYTKRLKFSIHYLDENNKVISTDRININAGYKNKIAKDLKLINVPNAPQGAVSFIFSYYGVMSGQGIRDENPGDWEIYFDPFKKDAATDQKLTNDGLFYAD